MLETLEVRECEELKEIITNDAEDDDHLNCTSIFPKLQDFSIDCCNKLEFIFSSTLSGALPKLKSIHIFGAHELKYGFGKSIHLLALESLSLDHVPNWVRGIGFETLEAPKEIKRHVLNETSEGAKESEIQEIVNLQTPLTPCFHNLKEIEISKNKKLKALFSVSACKQLPQLSKLAIDECEELVNVVEDDDHHHHQISNSSFFPKLEDLKIWDCNKLEFIFPLSFVGALQKLKSLYIHGAAELKYIFGKYDEDGDYLSNENESDVLHIHLPALESLTLKGMPKMINNICAKKYHLRFPPLLSINLSGVQKFNGRSFSDFMASIQGIQLNVKTPKDLVMKMIKDVQKLTNLTLEDSNMEDVLNLEGVQIEGPVMTLSLEEMSLRNLSELRQIWKGPKYILSLPNLQELRIRACKKLKAIFSVSIMRSLPQLSDLTIEECDELVDIIEEESNEDHLHHRLCFPKLGRIEIKRCNSLKFLFSISTCGTFPELNDLEIEESCGLEQVFVHKQDDMQKVTIIGQVFPKLSQVTLRKLPQLINICEGIDFRALTDCEVDDCPKYQAPHQIQEGPENEDSENQTSASQDFAQSSKESMKASVDEVESSMSKEQTVKEIEAKDDPTPALENQAPKGSTSLNIMEETSIEIEAKQPTSTSEQQASETSASQLRETFLRNTNVILKERVEEGHTLDDVAVATTIVNPASANSNSSSVTSSIVSQVEGLQSSPSTLVASKEKTHEQDSQGDDATEKATIAIQSTDSESRKQTKGLLEKEREAIKVHTSQLSPASTLANSKSIKDTMEQGVEENYAEVDAMIAVSSTNSDLRKQSTRPADNLSAKDSAPTTAKETTKGIDEKATATNTSQMATPFIRGLNVKETGDHSTVQEEAESQKPIKAILPQVIPSLHHQSRIADSGTSSTQLGICEIFQLVELKHGETALLAQALERYPQLLLPREH